MAEQAGESQRQVQRYIRLTELIPPLPDMVDEKKIAFNPAYELSFLTKEEQAQLVETMDYEQAAPSLSQALQKPLKTGRRRFCTWDKIISAGKLTGALVLLFTFVLISDIMLARKE